MNAECRFEIREFSAPFAGTTLSGWVVRDLYDDCPASELLTTKGEAEVWLDIVIGAQRATDATAAACLRPDYLPRTTGWC